MPGCSTVIHHDASCSKVADMIWRHPRLKRKTSLTTHKLSLKTQWFSGSTRSVLLASDVFYHVCAKQARKFRFFCTLCIKKHTFDVKLMHSQEKPLKFSKLTLFTYYTSTVQLMEHNEQQPQGYSISLRFPSTVWKWTFRWKNKINKIRLSFRIAEIQETPTVAFWQLVKNYILVWLMI